MKIVIPGGSGQTGTLLARAFQREGHEVVVLSRNPLLSRPWRLVAWDGRSLGAWKAEIDGADVIINLAGHTVNCRYNKTNRRRILASRVNSTKVIGEAIAAATRPPGVWLQAGTATIYAHRYDAGNDEHSGILGGSEPDVPETWWFSISVASAWEEALSEADVPKTRKVVMRSAMTMSPDRGGVFDVLLGLIRRGLGGQMGNGQQFVSWVHDQDFIAVVNWLIAHPELEGAVNIAAPDPLPNAEFMRTLRRAWGMPLGLPAARWMLEIGAAFLRTETELILKSRRVIPTRLLESGFNFEFPTWDTAAVDLCQRWRRARQRGYLSEG